ncbi:hypothetical protein CHCC20441_1011 [Bacillus licheniformis]|uniref:Uncharacterized protein n=1 Tax=Bacillus licheniformis TaxID=1402 RepID=A0A8B5YE91_BACLI|nr:hypothetical protein N399_04320 [Bacillus licheniformis CG-B52]KUL08238.1 hypothetical protein LI17339_18390 [Bacillus licheniformis LMG 17339]KYC74295.1 hypothetical protein B4090_0856 [Bacillus licheniformis]KYC77585.1 hypothetical protein B4092_0852 [Bacillus licheniformis]KYC82963.1 hypothetical protein B4091_0843 [Bacillus licheniformis]
MNGKIKETAEDLTQEAFYQAVKGWLPHIFGKADNQNTGVCDC